MFWCYFVVIYLLLFYLFICCCLLVYMLWFTCLHVLVYLFTCCCLLVYSTRLVRTVVWWEPQTVEPVCWITVEPWRSPATTRKVGNIPCYTTNNGIYYLQTLVYYFNHLCTNSNHTNKITKEKVKFCRLSMLCHCNYKEGRDKPCYTTSKGYTT